MRQNRSQNAQWLPAGFTIREFGAKAHSRAETGSRLLQPHGTDEVAPVCGPGVIHVLNGKALTAKGRQLLARAKVQ